MKAPALACLTLLALTGCSRGFFSAHGTVASDGPDRIHTWRSTPQGCSRDPFDGDPVGQTRSILTLLWEDPGMRVPTLDNRFSAPDAPMRLELARTPGDPAGTPYAMLRTIRNQGILLDQSVCRTLRLSTQQHDPVIRGGRPTLSGSLALDCRAANAHITADVTFTRCSY